MTAGLIHYIQYRNWWMFLFCGQGGRGTSINNAYRLYTVVSPTAEDEWVSDNIATEVSTVHYNRHLDSSEHCTCTPSMTNIRPGRDSNPVPLSFEPAGSIEPSGPACWGWNQESGWSLWSPPSSKQSTCCRAYVYYIWVNPPSPKQSECCWGYVYYIWVKLTALRCVYQMHW